MSTKPAADPGECNYTGVSSACDARVARPAARGRCECRSWRRSPWSVARTGSDQLVRTLGATERNRQRRGSPTTAVQVHPVPLLRDLPVVNQCIGPTHPVPLLAGQNSAARRDAAFCEPPASAISWVSRAPLPADPSDGRWHVLNSVSRLPTTVTPKSRARLVSHAVQRLEGPTPGRCHYPRPGHSRRGHSPRRQSPERRTRSTIEQGIIVRRCRSGPVSAQHAVVIADDNSGSVVKRVTTIVVVAA